MIKRQYFITGTDTNVGKTYITSGLLIALQEKGYSTIGLKPVATGCDLTLEGVRNSDALALQKLATVKLDYSLVNPLAYQLAVSPHILSNEICVQNLIELCQPALSHQADVCLIEGVGGWYVPLNEQQTMADFVKSMNLPTILVVGMRLGCLNHALLTQQAILADGVELVGWVANCVDPTMQSINENIRTLEAKLNAPLLGVVPYADAAENRLNVQLLVS